MSDVSLGARDKRVAVTAQAHVVKLQRVPCDGEWTHGGIQRREAFADEQADGKCIVKDKQYKRGQFNLTLCLSLFTIPLRPIVTIALV
jgi:hypothetical protein